MSKFKSCLESFCDFLFPSRVEDDLRVRSHSAVRAVTRELCYLRRRNYLLAKQLSFAKERIKVLERVYVAAQRWDKCRSNLNTNDIDSACDALESAVRAISVDKNE